MQVLALNYLWLRIYPKKHTRFSHILPLNHPLNSMYQTCFFIECTNILWKYVRRFDYPADKASKNLMNLEKLALQRIPTSDLMVGALDIAVSYTISAYDACYVAHAQRLNVPLVTADEKLINTLANSTYTVRWLGDFPIPPKNDK
jgi:predicted nucleic acid-binding protein